MKRVEFEVWFLQKDNERSQLAKLLSYGAIRTQGLLFDSTKQREKTIWTDRSSDDSVATGSEWLGSCKVDCCSMDRRVGAGLNKSNLSDGVKSTLMGDYVIRRSNVRFNGTVHCKGHKEI